MMIGVAVIMLAVGLLGGGLVREKQHQRDLANAREKAAAITAEKDQLTQQDVARIQNENRAETDTYQQSMTDELDEQHTDLNLRQHRIDQREEAMKQTQQRLDDHDQDLRQRRAENREINEGVKERRHQANDLIQKRSEVLETQAGITHDEAGQHVIIETQRELAGERDIQVRELTEIATAINERRAKDLIVDAIQRGPEDLPKIHIEHTITVPNGEVRSKIIGREGQHIRLLETLTGTDLLFEPDDKLTLYISTHDPIRREVARTAVENLIAGRRVSVSAIQAQVAAAEKEVMKGLRETGETVASRLHVGWVHPDLMKTIGRLKYRTSYGQNMLLHSIEVAELAGLMAQELGIDVRLAKRAGLLHDIGKALDHEVDGTHVEIGTEIAEKYGEDPLVVNAIEASHGDVEKTNPISVLVATADSISGGRPGARSESVEEYINRLHALENIARSHDGVSDSYAIQAGREIRIIVKPNELDDEATATLSNEVANQVEHDLTYPGKIKVTALRTFEADEYVGDDHPKKKKKKKKAG